MDITRNYFVNKVYRNLPMKIFPFVFAIFFCSGFMIFEPSKLKNFFQDGVNHEVEFKKKKP